MTSGQWLLILRFMSHVVFNLSRGKQHDRVAHNLIADLKTEIEKVKADNA